MTGSGSVAPGDSAGIRQVLLCGLVSIVGVAVVLGCLLALTLEAQGFGRPRDTGVRPGYVAELLVGAVAGIAVPAGLGAALLPNARAVIGVIVAAALALVTMVALMGLG